MIPKQRNILGDAQQLLNADPSASMTAIAEAVGVSRATMHRYFPTREHLMGELRTRSLDRWEAELDEGSVDEVATSEDADLILSTIGTLVRAYVADAHDFGFAIADHVIYADASVTERIEDLTKREVRLWVAGQKAGVLRDDLPARWICHAVYGLLLAGREATRQGDVAPRELADLVLSTFLHGARQQ